MNDMRKLMNLVESIERGEILEEGIREKVLAAVAAAGIMMGPNAEADTVFVYQSSDNTMVTVEEFMDIPDEAQMAYALDTETQAMKMIKSPGGSQAAAPAESGPDFSGEYGEDIKGFVQRLAGKFYDPDSATFRNIKIYKLADGNVVIGGYVNAKNRMGGFVGAEAFLFSPTGITNPGRMMGKAFFKFLTKPGGGVMDGKDTVIDGMVIDRGVTAERYMQALEASLGMEVNEKGVVDIRKVVKGMGGPFNKKKFIPAASVDSWGDVDYTDAR